MKLLTDRISTVVLVMLENRSFDNMLGHLRYEDLVPGVDGLEANLTQYENMHLGGSFRPFRMSTGQMAFDLPHEWNEVASQLDYSEVNEQFRMAGFVTAYAKFTQTHPVQNADPMGFFTAADVPITNLLARQFCTCDKWHSPLPTSTQPNRTMAFCGASTIFDTPSGPRLIPCEDILLDWLTRANVRWRVYHDGLSFFALYRQAWKHILNPDDRFRDFERYFYDMQTEPIDKGPQVIIVEPSYNDAPHIGPDHPNDNHPPLAIGWGEDFLRRVYQAATADHQRWEKTVLIYYYDEHGGFYDHVVPPRIPYTTRGNPAHTFESLGPRVPAIVVSPLVEPGSVCHELFDHTSVLQLLAERFTPGRPFSADVQARQLQGIQSLSVALGDVARTEVPELPSDPIVVSSALGAGVRLRPENGMQASFELAASQLMASDPIGVGRKYPELSQWKAVVDAQRRQVPT